MTGFREITIHGHSYAVTLDERTSKRLGHVRRANTKPEEMVREVLRGLRLRYKTGNRSLPGSPDFANVTRRWAIFVHGCYWHHHLDCRKATTPTTNREFWLAKFADNQRRDRRAVRALRQLGYRVIVIWECESLNVHVLKTRLMRLGGSK